MDFKDFLIANGITDSEKINAMTNKLETILYAGYPYNGANLYSNADTVDTITVEQYNKFLVPPSVIRKDFPDEIGNEVFTYNDIMSKNEKYKKLQKFVKKVFDMGDSTTKSGLTVIEIHSLPFYQAIMATNYGDPIQVLPAMMGDSYYLTEYQAYEATSNAIWSLMAENGVPDNSPVQKKPLTNSLLGLSGANILKSEPSSSAVSITGDGEFKFDTTDKKWKTGTLTLNAPSNYYAKYTFQLPDGVKTLNGKDFASAGESFQLVSDNEPADNLFVSASADVLWMEGNLKVYHPPEGLLSKKLDTNGNPERFQNMVGAVINKANVGTSMVLSKESTEVSFTVTKNWDDDNNRDGLRPSDLDYASKVHLMNGNTEVTGVTPVITDNNDNTYTISYGNLNKHINGENTDYKLKEDSITGYTPSAETVKNGETLVNTHTPETVDISITKNWVDVNNQDGIRPTATEYTGMVHLMKGENADNEVEGVVPVVTDNGNGTYTVKYTGLPKKENGTDIQYSVKEDILDGYKADTYTVKNGETITNTHNVGTTYISITKAWSDGNNQDGKRPSASQFASMVKLYRDNDVEVKGVTPVVEDNLDGTYKISYENLPKNSNGQPIEYSIKEENVDGYTADKTVVKNGDTLTNTHMPETFTLIVTKSWNDDGNRDGLRPGTDLFAGKLSLMKNNTVVEGATPVVRDNGNNTYTIEYANLQKYENGTEINYSVKEDGVDGYTADKTAAKNGETITNTHIPEVIDITVTKNWVDDNNRDGIRPGANDFASKLHLMNGETEVTGVVPSVVDNNDGTYTVKYTNLAKNAAGTPITYSVKEDAVSGYTTDNNTALNGGVIINTHTPERTNVVVTKKWDDNNNQDRVRPDTAAFARELHLKAGERENTDVTPEVTIGADNTYVITYSNLLKNENGAAITYTVSEGAITGYATDNNSAVNGGTITNVHTPDTTEITITKRWDDGNNQDGIRPDADAFKSKLHLLEDGSEVNGATAEVIDNNDGTYTVKYANLQKNKDGNAIEYTISEDGVDGYTADKTAAKNGETITNTHIPEVIDITVTKNWVDDNNRDGIRPGANDFASKLHLMNGETEVTGVVPSVVDNNDGTYTVKYTNLAKNAAGTPITYSVKEDAVSGYTTDNNTALNGGVIINTHTPERTNVVVTKKWDDNNNQDRVRPGADEFASKLHLLADGTEVNGVTAEVVDNNDGTYTVTYSDILKYENGNIIVYGITEDDIAGYSSAQDVVYEGEVLVNVHKVKENNGENGGNKDNTDNNSKNNLNNKSDKKVDTSDHSNNMIYYLLIVISATGIISAAAVAGRKKH